MLSDLDEAAVSSAAAGLAGAGSAVCDVRDEAQVQKLVAGTVAGTATST